MCKCKDLCINMLLCECAFLVQIGFIFVVLHLSTSRSKFETLTTRDFKFLTNKEKYDRYYFSNFVDIVFVYF